MFSERYRLVRRLGAGGMAEVFEVEHLLTKRRLALKLLHAESLGNPTSVERFYREASACAGIDSDHIVQIIDCDVDRSTAIPFLVMELLQGDDLAQYITKQWEAGAGIPPTTVTSLLKQVGSALDKVHAQGIVHRDLKPANLFVTFPDDGPPRVKILDFGIAKHLLSDVSSTPSGRLGTPLYMAAEQVTHRAPISAQTDVTAVALIAYEMLVGKAYWHGLSAAAIFARLPDRAAHHAPSASAAKHGVNLPAGFDAWMLRCLDTDPSRRPVSVSVAVGELLRVYDPRATQPPIGAPAPAGIGRIPTPPRSPVTDVPAPRAPSLHATNDAPAERRLVPRAATRPKGSGPSIPPPPPPTQSIDEPDPLPEVAAVAEPAPVEVVPAPQTPDAEAVSETTVTKPRRVRSRLRRPVEDPDEALYTAPTRRLPVFRLPGEDAPIAPSLPSPEPVAAAPETLTPEPVAAAPETPAPEPAPRVSTPPPPPPSTPRRSAPPPPPPAAARSATRSTPPSEPAPRAPVVMDEDAPMPEAPPAPLSEIDHEALTPMATPVLAREPAPAEVSGPVDRLGANIDAALSDPAPPPRSRRVPRTLEMAKTMLLPVFEARSAVRPWMLAAATAGTLVLAATAAWVLLRDDPPPAPVEAPRAWTGPTAGERQRLSAVTAAWAESLRNRRVSGQGFGESVGAPPAGLDTARAFTALLAAHAAGTALEPAVQLDVLLALDRARAAGHWTERDGAAAVGTVEATAWALLAYVRLASITQAPTARARVEVARAALVAVQREDGAFAHRPDGTHAASPRPSLRGAWALVEGVRPGDGAAAETARARSLRWLRAALDDGQSAVSRDATLTAQAVYVLARAHALGDRDADDMTRVEDATRRLFAWCDATPTTAFDCARPAGDDGTGLDPWRPWTLLALDALSRESLLGARAQAQAARVLRASVGRFEEERASIGRRPTEVLAVYALAASALRGE